jgi:hypothetical protein
MMSTRLRTWEGEVLDAPTDGVEDGVLFLVVFYWRETCSFCISHMEQMETFYDYTGIPITDVRAVYVGNNQQAARDTMKAMGLTYTSLVGPAPRFVTGVPATQIHVRQDGEWHTPRELTWIGVVQSEELWGAITDYYTQNMTGDRA